MAEVVVGVEGGVVGEVGKVVVGVGVDGVGGVKVRGQVGSYRPSFVGDGKCPAPELHINEEAQHSLTPSHDL